MKRTCPIDPACTLPRPEWCKPAWRAHCQRLVAWRASFTPEAWAAWCEEDDRSFALEASLDASAALLLGPVDLLTVPTRRPRTRTRRAA